MKTKFAILLLFQLLFIGNSFSQDFAPIGATWYFPETFSFSGDIGVVTFSSIGDTIIQNKQAKIVYKDTWTCYGEAKDYYFHQSNDSIYKYVPSTDTFELSFIFNAAVGDQWIINELPEFDSDSMECTVDSISFIHLSPSDSLRVQHVTLRPFDINGNLFPNGYPNRIIEKIGFSIALTAPFESICDVNREKDIRCYEDNQSGLINFSAVDCLLTSTEAIDKENAINIFPNPTTNSITLAHQLLTIKQIEIFNVQGQKMATIKSGFEQLDFSNYPNGIYILKIVTTEKILSKKIVIEK